MPNTRVALLVVALAAASLWWFWPRDEAPRPADATPGSTRPATTGEATTAPAAERTATGPTTDQPTTATIVVRGRCLAAEDGQPVVATVHVGLDDDAAVDEPLTLLQPPAVRATADANGHFTCTLPLDAPTDLRVHASAAGRAPAGARNRATTPGTVWDLGDVRLVRSARVRGEVVDTSGAPVPEVEVGLLMLGQEPPALQFRESHTTVTDARGAFAFANPVAAGEWYVRVERTGALRTPRKLQVEGGVDQDVRIEVERPDPRLALRGKVVDRTGAPLADVEISAYGEGVRGRGMSTADGTFVVHKGPPHFDRGQGGVEVMASADGFEQASPRLGQVDTWGRSDVVVVMRPLVDFTVRAVDDRGAPVWPFTVVVGEWSTSGATWMPRRRMRLRHGTDHLVLQGLGSGSYSLLLVPGDATLPTTAPEAFVVAEDAARERIVRVPDRVAVVVDVVDTGGGPIAGCTVELVASLTGNPPEPTAAAPDLEAARSAPVPGVRQVAVATATTDATGRATLAAAAGPWLLRARCTTHHPTAQPISATPAGQPHRLVLAGAATVHGRLLPLAALPALGLGQAKPERRLAVVALAGKEQVARTEVAADGTFVLGPLPPAAVALQLLTWLAANEVSNNTLPHALGEVDGANVGRIDRDYDVGPFVPATAAGLVLWDGQPLRHGQFFLRRLQPGPVRAVRVPTDGDGRFRTLVPPGELGPQLAIPSDPGPGHVVLPLAARHTVGPGQTIDLRIEAQTRRLRLRLLLPDGSVLANARTQPFAEGYQRPGTLTTDAAGRVDFVPAPFGPFRLTAKDATGRELAADCDVPAAAEATVVDIRLQPATR
ncbi:MAG: carboxypeptidase regulatory-like domain-containing protein [Planctomycetes bacterium]|nr:carboxypeptidase regulatory-like domain-containing protein [Planctomycetota bacterium]